MKLSLRSRSSVLLACSLAALVSVSPFAFATPGDALSGVKTQADLDKVIAETADAKLKQAIKDNAAAILAAADEKTHVEAILKAIEISPGKVEKINATPDSLKQAAGGDISLFETLKVVDLGIPNAGPHDHRKTDPYDAAFFEHVGQLSKIESLNIIATKCSDDWIAPLGKLKTLKALKFTNNGKLSDVGLEKLAGLKQLEAFSFVGTGMKGHAYAKFEGWTALTRVSHRGSSIDDEGLTLLCEKFPNLESISLAHAKCGDAGVAALPKLTKLKGLELGSKNATPGRLVHVAKMSLEYLQLGDGLDAPEGIAAIKGMTTLRRLTLTNAKSLADADLQAVAGIKGLESLELNSVELTDERLPLLKSFSHLKELRIVNRPKGYTPEMQAKVKELLPKVTLKFE